MKRSALIRIHNALAVVFLPLLFIYAFTGAISSFGEVHAPSETVKIESFDTAAPGAADRLIALAAEKGVTVSGEMKNFKGMTMLGSPTGDHVIVKNGKEGAEVSIVHPGIIDKLVLAHKAKTGPLFSIIGVVLAVSLVLVLITGLILALTVQKLKKETIAYLGAGTLATIIAVALI